MAERAARMCARSLPVMLLVLVSAVVGGGAPVVAGETEGDRPVPAHEPHTPAQRKRPHGPSGETRTLNGRGTPWRQWQHATGDWGGKRPWLDEHAITPEVTYTGEVFSNLHGGINTGGATEYRGNLDVTLTVDGSRLGWWPGARFFLYLQNGHGRGLTNTHVGDIQTISNIDAGEFTQISEYWLEQRLLNGRVRVKLGKQDANADFCAVDYGGAFIHSSFGVMPTVPVPTFPDPALGAMAFLNPTDWLALGVGVYDGAPRGGTSGFDTAFDGTGGAFSVVEAALRTSLVDAAWNHGTYRVGFWYHSEDVEEVGAAPAPHTFSGNHGIYLAFDQTLLKERAEPQDEQGLGAFVQLGWTPEDRNETTLYAGTGMTYTGAAPGRDHDVLGVAVAHARFSDRVERAEGLTHETVVEVFYEAQVVPWLTLQPDLQFIANPGGHRPDAVAAGMRFAIAF